MNTPDQKNGGTPLHWAVGNNNHDAIVFLLKKPKIDLSIRDNCGKAAFDIASAEIKELLTAAINKKNNINSSATRVIFEQLEINSSLVVPQSQINTIGNQAEKKDPSINTSPEIAASDTLKENGSQPSPRNR